MPGYGGILSGLVQGYGQAVIGNEKRQREEKEKKQQQELRMYQMILENPDADPATKQAAFGKIEETIHGGGNGKKSQGPGLLSKIGGLLSGHMGGQSQPTRNVGTRKKFNNGKIGVWDGHGWAQQ